MDHMHMRHPLYLHSPRGLEGRLEQIPYYCTLHATPMVGMPQRPICIRKPATPRSCHCDYLHTSMQHRDRTLGKLPPIVHVTGLHAERFQIVRASWTETVYGMMYDFLISSMFCRPVQTRTQHVPCSPSGHDLAVMAAHKASDKTVAKESRSCSHSHSQLT